MAQGNFIALFRFVPRLPGIEKCMDLKIQMYFVMDQVGRVGITDAACSCCCGYCRWGDFAPKIRPSEAVFLTPRDSFLNFLTPSQKTK